MACEVTICYNISAKIWRVLKVSAVFGYACQHMLRLVDNLLMAPGVTFADPVNWGMCKFDLGITFSHVARKAASYHWLLMCAAGPISCCTTMQHFLVIGLTLEDKGEDLRSPE